ncbi:MAG: hypothetical protein KAW12_14950, partial [Candidatus Aminicenantes bacterium]|nr:hypothetical protein [Candidatus Aminicenantes bacterium]
MFNALCSIMLVISASENLTPTCPGNCTFKFKLLRTLSAMLLAPNLIVPLKKKIFKLFFYFFSKLLPGAECGRLNAGKCSTFGIQHSEGLAAGDPAGGQT